MQDIPPDRGGDGPGVAGDVARVAVELNSLADYTTMLQGQLTSLAAIAGKLHGTPAFGGMFVGRAMFCEAVALDGRHTRAVLDMQALLGRVSRGIARAQQAAEQIHDEYKSTDDFAAARVADVARTSLGPKA